MDSSLKSVQACDLPEAALLRKYQLNGAFTDCYFIDVPREVSHAEYVETFYTTTAFKVERHILAWLAAKPSSDRQAKKLATGEGDQFAAWSVEGRSANQLLLCDFMGKTRSWLMCEAIKSGPSTHTRLYFGSAVVPKRKSTSEKMKLGFAFHALMGFHKLYSKILLRSAAVNLFTKKSAS
jgi:hypothetical protein